MVGNILIQIGMGIFSVMYNLYIKELGMKEAVNGNVIAMTALATAIMLIPAGLLSDRFGRKWALIIGTGLTAITFFIEVLSLLNNRCFGQHSQQVLYGQ